MNGCIAREVQYNVHTGYKVQVQDEWKRKYHRALEDCGENSSRREEKCGSNEKVPCVVDF
eukprot:scaffold40962_cov178-Skeletonema_dohrnii-CCMP3373.AAC.2